MISASICHYEQFLTDWYKYFAGAIRFPVEVSPDNPQGYRKVWEWAAIYETLNSRGYLKPGCSGMGFAVGQEPLPSMMAARGVQVVASDLDISLVDRGWVETGQHASNLDALFREELVDRDAFDKLVSFTPADMNNLPEPTRHFDFVWSSCAFEHLGSIEKGMEFVSNAMDLLKPGGLAVHTTEFNIVSNDETIEEGDNCVYRRRDFEKLDAILRQKQCCLEPIDYNFGHHPYDLLFDVPPYYLPGRVHIKLQMEKYIVTSALILARKA